MISFIREELKRWEKTHGIPLNIGSKVRVKYTSDLYEAEYDQNTDYKVTLLYVDSGGLNIGIEQFDSSMWSAEKDGYRITDLKPV